MQVDPSSFSISETTPVASVVGVFNATLDGAVNSSIAIFMNGSSSNVFQLVQPADDGVSAAQIELAQPLDYEAVASYTLSVLLQLQGLPNTTDTVDIAVLDAPEAPVALNASAQYALPHNQAAPLQLLPPVQALNPAPSPAQCEFVGPFAPDEGAFQTLFQTRTTNSAGRTACTVELVQTLSLSAAENYSAGVNISNTAGWVTVPVQVLVAAPPPGVSFNASSLGISVLENSVSPVLIGNAVSARVVPDGAGAPDCALAPPYTPSLAAVHSAFGAVAQASGDPDETFCRVLLTAPLDAEQIDSYAFRLRANSSGAEAFAGVTVTVTNVNEPPMVQSTAATIVENTGPGVLVAQLVGSDPEGAQLAFQLEQEHPLFMLEPDGRLFTRGNVSSVPEATGSVSFEALAETAGAATFRDVSQAGAAAGWDGSFSAGYAVNLTLAFSATAGGQISAPGLLHLAVTDEEEPPLFPLPSVVGPPEALWGGGDPPLHIPTLYVLENVQNAHLAASAAAARAGAVVAAPPVPCFTPDLAEGGSDCAIDQVLLLPRSAQNLLYTYGNRSLALPAALAGVPAVAASCGGAAQWGAVWTNGSQPTSACRDNGVLATPYAQTTALNGSAFTAADLPPPGAQLWLGEHTTTPEPQVCFQVGGAPPYTASLQTTEPCQAANFEARSEYHVLFRAHSQRRPAGPRSWLLARVRVVDAPDPTKLAPPSSLVSAPEDLAPGDAIVGSELYVEDEDAETITVQLRPEPSGGCNVLEYRPPLISRHVDGTRAPYLLQLRAGAELPNAVFTCQAQALNSTGAVVATAQVTVIVEDLNDPPVPAALLVTGSVAENSPGGTVVAVLNATDADLRQNLTFTVTNALSSVFQVVPLLNPSNDTSPGAPAFVFRSALLQLRTDCVDYEAMAARNFTYTVPMRVTDTAFLRRDGAFSLDSSKVSESADFTVQLRVLDMPDEPIITQVRSLSPYGLSTAGSDFVELRGQHFGTGVPTHPDVPFRINAVLTTSQNTNITEQELVERIVSSCSAFTWRDVTVFLAQECTVTEAHIAVQCRVPPGFGEGHHWGVVLGGLLALPQGANPLVFDPQVPLALQAQTLWPQGRSQFQSCDGVVLPAVGSAPMCAADAAARPCPQLPQPAVPVQPAGACSSAADPAAATCRRLPQFSGWSGDTTAYGSPSVVRVEGSGARAAATRGGEQVTITGTNFALRRFAAVTEVTYGAQGTGFTARACNMTRDHAELSCFTGVGVGSALQWQVSVATLSSAVPSTSYAVPSVQAVFTAPRFANGTLGPRQNTSVAKLSTGGDSTRRLLIVGDNFGPAAAAAGRRLQAAPQPRHLSTAAVQPWSSAGALASVSGRWLQSIAPVSAVSVTLQSPLSGQVFPVTGCSIREAFQEIQCDVPQAVGQNLSVEVQVGGLVSPLSRGAAAVVAYHPPFISTPPRSIPVLGTRVDITGSNFTGPITGVATQVFFGSQLFSVEAPCSAAGCNVSVLSPAPEQRLAATAVTDVNFREIRFDAPPGEGRNVPLRVLVGGQSSNTVTTYSYVSTLELLQVKPQLAPQSSPSDQQVYVQIQSARGRLQLSACCWALRVVAAHTTSMRNSSAAASQNTIAPCFREASFGANEALDVDFPSDGSSMQATTSAYENALNVLEGVQGGAENCQCSSTDPHHVQVEVENDGGTAVSSDIVAVLDSGSELLVVARICRVQGSALRITAGGTALGETEGGYDYFNSADAPVVERIDPPVPSPAGGALLVLGRNFRELSGKLFLREFLVCGTTQRSEIQLPVHAWGVFNATDPAEAGWFGIRTTLPPAPPGTRRQLAVRVQSENATSSLESSAFSFATAVPPSVTWAQASGPTQGFQFAGEAGNLSPGDAPLLHVTLSGTTVVETQSCGTPANNPSPLAIGTAPVSGMPSYKLQDDSRVWPLRVLVGTGNDALCRIQRVQGDTIMCRVPAGQHNDAELTVQVYARRSSDDADPWLTLGGGSTPTRYSYDKPVLTALALHGGRSLRAGGVTLGPTVGQSQRVLHGSSLGGNEGQLQLTGADGETTPLEVRQWNHTYVLFDVEPGIGGAVALRATAPSCVGTQCTSEILRAAYDAPRVDFLQEELSADAQRSGTSTKNGSTAQLDARRSEVLIAGANFGLVDLVGNSVSLGGQPCEATNGETVRTGDDTLECTLKDIPVGPLNLSIAVAGQRLFQPAATSRVLAECREGFFGVVPGVDRCKPCPTCTTPDCKKLSDLTAASTCSGGGALPQASAGFWRTDAFSGVRILNVDQDAVNATQLRVVFSFSEGAFDLIQAADPSNELGIQSTLTMAVPAADSRSLAQQAAAFLADTYGSSVRYSFTRCEPPEACLGGNLCRVGYEGAACSLCVAGEYQRDFLTNTCRPCPPEPLLNFVGILVGVLVAALVLYKLYQKGPSVAALSIAVDYLQIISVFGTLNLEWPPVLLQVFRIAAASAASVDTASPDCAVAIGYIAKWYFQMLLPVIVAVVFAVAHLFIVLGKFLKRRKFDFKSLTKHSDKMLGSWLLMCSFLYIALTAKAFEALSCQQVAAKPVLTADPAISCESADYLAMRQWAIVAVFVYGLGIPLFFATLIYMYGARMKVDQALRIRNLAGSRDTNPFYDMSKRYRRLYFKFKPEYNFWILLILSRKFLIVAATFVLQRRPVMAATVITVVLFGSVMLQMLNNPYRSHNSEKKEDEDRQKKAAAAAATPQPFPKRSSAAGSGSGSGAGAGGGTVNPLQSAKEGGQHGAMPPKGIAGLISGRGVKFREEDLLNDDSHMFANDPQVTAAAVAAQQKQLKAVAGGGGGGRFAKRGLTINGRTRGDSLFARMASIANLSSPTGSKRHPPARNTRSRAESKMGPRARQPGAVLGVRPRRMVHSQAPAQPHAEQERHGSLSGACSCCPCGAVERVCDALYVLLCGGRCCTRLRVAAGCGRAAPRATPLRLASSSTLRQNAIKATAGASKGTGLVKRRYSLVGALGTRHVNASHAASAGESPYAWVRRQCVTHCPCCKGQSLSDLQLRAEARTGGKTKIKLKYVFDYNRLEATFLCCAIFVLLSGVMFKSVDCDIASDTTVGVDGDVAVGEAGAGSSADDAAVERATLQAVVLVLIAVSTAICIATVAAEMWLGFRYFLLAGKARRQAEREQRRALAAGKATSSTKLLAGGGSPRKSGTSGNGSGSPTRGSREEQPQSCPARCSRRALLVLSLTCSACVRAGGKCGCRCQPCRACAHTQGPTPPDSDDDNGDIELADKSGKRPVFMTSRQRAISRAVRSAAAHAAEEEEEDGAAVAWQAPDMQAKLAAMAGYSPPAAARGRSSSKDPAALMPTSPGMYRPQRDAQGGVSVSDVALRRTAVMQRLAALKAKSSDISRAEQAALKVVHAREQQGGGGDGTPPSTPSTGASSSALAHTAVAAAHYGLLSSTALPPEALRTLETLSKAEAYQKLQAEEQRAKWANTPVVGGLLRRGDPPAPPRTPGEDVQHQPPRSTVSTASATVTSGGRVHVDSPLQALALVGDTKHGRLASASSVPVDPRSRKGKALKLPKDVSRVVGVTAKDLSKRMARYAFSVHLGRAGGLPASVPQGSQVTLTLRKDQSKERVLFAYRAGQHVRCREMRLLVVDPRTDVVHGTLSLDSRGRSGAAVVRSEQLIGTFAIAVKDFELANPTRDEFDGGREPLAGRREVHCQLRDHLGEPTGHISLFCRLQHRGVALDDWTAMQLGARDFADIAAPARSSSRGGGAGPARTLVGRADAGDVGDSSAIGVRDAQDFDSADIHMQGETPVRRSARAQRSMTWHRSEVDAATAPASPAQAANRQSMASRLSILPKKRHPRGSIAFQIVQNEEGRNVAVPYRSMSAASKPPDVASPGSARQQLPSSLSEAVSVDASGRSSIVNPLVMAATMQEGADQDEGAMRRRFSMQRARVAVPTAPSAGVVSPSAGARARRSLQVQMHGSMREQMGRLKAYSSVSRLEPAAEPESGALAGRSQHNVGLGLLEETSQSGEESEES